MHTLKLVVIQNKTTIIAKVLSGRLTVGCRLWTPKWEYVGTISEIYCPKFNVCFPSTVVRDTYCFDLKDVNNDIDPEEKMILYSF